MKRSNISLLQLVLTTLFVASLMISNVVTAKQVQLPFDIVMTGGVVIFPVTYILSDLFSEIYGYRWSRITCYLAFAINLFMVIVFAIVIETPAPSYWGDQEAFQTVLGSTPRVLFASMMAFIIGDFVNDRIFKKLKERHPDSHEGFSFRAIVSSLCGEVVDSAIFLPIVFLGEMPFAVLLIMMATEVTIKTSYEIIILPITKIIMKKVSGYELKQKGGVECE